MKKKKKAAPKKSWAQRAVEDLTPEQVRYWCDRLGVKVPPDTRSPIERMIDEACSKKPKR